MQLFRVLATNVTGQHNAVIVNVVILWLQIIIEKLLIEISQETLVSADNVIKRMKFILPQIN